MKKRADRKKAREEGTDREKQQTGRNRQKEAADRKEQEGTGRKKQQTGRNRQKEAADRKEQTERSGRQEEIDREKQQTGRTDRMRIGNQVFDTANETYIMGILNVTPDSFSDGGKWNRMDAALWHTEEMIAEGAAVIDVGGESTRPGYTIISDEEEIGRTIPVIEAIKRRFDIPVSIDTYKSSVAKAAITAGVDLVNDIWGLKYDPDMAKVIAEAEVACCLMHNRNQADYADFMEDMLMDLRESLTLAEQADIAKDKIILDPGVGFGKTYENNLTAIRKAGCLLELGYPILLGTSRKSVVGLTLDTDKDQRVEGTLVTTVFAVQQGCSFVRVHDVLENARAIRMTRAILQETGKD